MDSLLPADELPPLDAARPPPFEGDGSFVGRFLRELAAAMHPRETAAGFALSDRLGPAVLFFALTFVPFSMLQGVIPWTHTLRFGDLFGVERIGNGDVATDILRAMGLGLLVQGVAVAAFVAAFRSLARAYGTPRPGGHQDLGRVALRAALYRAWLLPMQGPFGLPIALLAWGLPKDAPGALVLFPVLILSIGPLILHFAAMRHAARQACGVGPIASFVVVLVPYVLMTLLQTMLVGDGQSSDALLTDWLPAPPEAPVD